MLKYNPINQSGYLQFSGKTHATEPEFSQVSAYVAYRSSQLSMPYEPAKQAVYQPMTRHDALYDTARKVREIQNRGSVDSVLNREKKNIHCHNVFLNIEITNEAEGKQPKIRRLGMFRRVIAEVLDFKKTMLASISKFKRLVMRQYTSDL